MHDEPTTASPGPDGRPHELQPKWRQDFPVDVPQDNYVARRDYVKFMVLTSGAFAVGQVSIGLDSILRQADGTPPRMEIARVDEVAVGGIVEFHYPSERDPCLLMRPDADTLLAYSQVCTHLACGVQPDIASGRIHCPCHNGWFNMATGDPTAGPPQRPLPRIVLEIEDGVIYATDVERRT
jgi:Rieske Fe-S protein